LEEATGDATDGAFKFGQQVRKVIATVIDLKDELKIVAGVIATIFVVSKISAAVSATIALIKTLIGVYNALKASAIIAGVAGYFALNPLAGLAAVGVAAAILAGATALVGRSDVSTDDLGGSGGVAGFSGTMPNGQSFSTDRSLGGRKETSPTKTIVDTSGLATVSKVAATAAAATSNVVSGGFNAGSFRMAEAASMGTTINLTVTGAFDKEGTARTIVETLNSSAYRGTGGAGNLVAL
jgi:hypothetical protein